MASWIVSHVYSTILRLVDFEVGAQIALHVDASVQLYTIDSKLKVSVTNVICMMDFFFNDTQPLDWRLRLVK